MSVRKSITLLTLLLSVSAAPFVAADVPGGLVARAALPPTICDLSNVRAAVALQTVARWRVIDRAIDRGLDRALLALRPRWPNAAMGDKALADLVAVVDQVSGKNQAGADGGRPPSEAAPSQARADAASRRSQVRIPSAPPAKLLI
jgi:hypothetical protein